MPVVLLVRHGRTDANGAGVLAGRSPGVSLDDAGRGQIEALRDRISPVRLSGVVSSPLDRCRQTAQILAGDDVPVRLDDALTECDYGSWTGRRLVDLRREKSWRVVQDHPSGAVFPDGEAMADVQARAVAAIRGHDRRIAAEAGPHAVWMAVSHGDVIKAVVADALGMHLDLFQRIVVDPGSVTAVSYTDLRPFVLRLNDTGGDLAAFRPPRRRGSRSRGSDAAVGGGGGPASG